MLRKLNKIVGTVINALIIVFCVSQASSILKLSSYKFQLYLTVISVFIMLFCELISNYNFFYFRTPVLSLLSCEISNAAKTAYNFSFYIYLTCLSYVSDESTNRSGSLPQVTTNRIPTGNKII